MRIFVLVLVGAASGGNVAAAGPTWVDKPAWPAKADAIEITWLVHPVPANATTPETTKAPLDLEITVGSVTRTIKLPPQLGALTPHNQVACKTSAYPLGKGEVAKITFYEGGAGGFLVRRSGGVLSIVDWFLGDGACPDKHGNPGGPCPGPTEKVKFQLHAPASVKIHEHIVEVDDAGVRRAFACT